MPYQNKRMCCYGFIDAVSCKKVVFSLEVFPPKKDNPVHVIYNTLLGLRGLPADFISVTYGAGGSAVQQSKTCEIASLIRSNYHIEPVSHLTCVNARKDKIIETLNTLKENGVQNILALRGDRRPVKKTGATLCTPAILPPLLRATMPPST